MIATGFETGWTENDSYCYEQLCHEWLQSVCQTICAGSSALKSFDYRSKNRNQVQNIKHKTRNGEYTRKEIKADLDGTIFACNCLMQQIVSSKLNLELAGDCHDVLCMRVNGIHVAS